MAKVGFIGLGNMGVPMAGNLVKKGHQVQGFDLVAGNLEKAKARGVATVASAADAAKGADIVVTMLPAGKDTIAVYEKSGILQAAPKGAILVDAFSRTNMPHIYAVGDVTGPPMLAH
ncbi:MAG TPA: NAD(P)-binding domain-containing protein, partial [Hyphomicrobiaceae bacterium]|nr:NAD(P)-binding domain-containing protein [Hyphomicrobiaceae bacterium]